MMHDDRGQAAIMMLVLAAVVFVAVSSATVVLGGAVIDRSRARTAADAAALAGLQGGRGAAVALAERHGAELVSFDSARGDHQVTVVVQVGDRTARARATDAP